ncbi:Pre-mRNA splicing [Coemansia sp. Benny D115]|nr:Pre-mRNA splicing [Coemansia sp. Benny D115]
MPEEFSEEHKKHYQYAGNSNLVLPSDRSKINRRGERGKEMESLWGKISTNDMGSNVRRQQAPPKPAKTAEQEAISQAKKQRRREQRQLKTNYGFKDILAATEDAEGMYRPLTQETRMIWDVILAQSRRYIGDQTPEVLASAADEALKVLKDDEVRELDKKKQVEQIFGSKIDEADFSRFIQLAKQITDYNVSKEEDASATAAVDDSGIAVMFGGSDDEEEGDYGDKGNVSGFVMGDSSSSEDDDDDDDINRKVEGVEGASMMDVDGKAAEAQSGADDASDMGEEDGIRMVVGERSRRLAHSGKQGTDEPNGPERLSPRSIDAFWLQRLLAKHYEDPQVLHEKTQEAGRLLADARLGLGELENELAEMLEYEHFETVQLLVSNRDVIVWCTRLARAEAEGGAEQRRAVEANARAAGASWILSEYSGVSAPDAAANAPAGSVDVPMASATTAEKQKAAAEYTPQSNIDLEDLAFSQGARLMTNEKWVAPEGATKVVMPGYEEIRVPAPAQLGPPGADEQAVSMSQLPQWAQAAFPNVEKLNRIQSRVYPTAFLSDDNMLICAPTGAGKTNCAALAMLRTVGQFRDAASGRVDTSAFKMVYIAPMKALVAEMAAAFASRLQPLGLTVSELTGDSQLTKAQITNTQLLVTTPEKWDVVTRKGGEGSYARLVRLVIIDEIHLLHDDRGPVLEALGARLKQQPNVRLVGLSATLPNYEDVAAFLRVPRDRALFHFDARYRPCPLQMEFVGLTDTKHIKRLERMDAVCYEKTQKQAAEGGQVLIFVHSRKETVRTAQRLRDAAMEAAQLDSFVRAGSASAEILREESEATRDAALADLLPFGLAVHHAGMARADRALAEELFADGHVRVLVSTATLAWGVNLPAHTVIIKGTQVYNPAQGAWMELSPQDVLQMLGRAGRPQFDTFGEGVIITAHSELRYYLSLMSQQLPIESQLVSRLPDALNAEVALGVVRSRADAADWLAHTYLFVRMLRSPTVYGLSHAILAEDPALLGRRTDLAHAAAVELERSGLVRYDRRSGRLVPTDLGRVASHYYITFRSMAAYQQHLRVGASDIDMLGVFARSDEFRLIPVRAEERVELARLVERVPVPIRDAADAGSGMAKVAALLQAHVARLKLPGFALAADAVYVTQSAGRIFRALFELCRARGWARASRCALGWCKQVERRMWLAASPLRQFGRECPPDLLRAIERKPLPWVRYLDLNEAELGELVASPQAGRLLHRLIHLVPRLDVRAHVQPLTRSLLRFELRLTPDFVWNDALHGAAEQFWVCVEDADGDRLLHSEVLVVKRAYAEQEHLLEFTCALTEPMPPQYFVTVDSDRWVGSETRLPVSFRHLQLPDRALPPTELLDMQPLPLAELRDAEFEAAYADIKSFNSIQTQAFNTLYRTDDSALIAATPGSGKTLAAELALMRFFRQEAARAQEEGDEFVRRRAVYLAPFATLVQQRAQEWRRRFADVQGGKTVVVLTGDTASDLRRVANAHVVVSTPAHWDGLSRRWRQRQRHAVREIGLLIADELHWVGGAGLGATADDVMLSVSAEGDSADADIVGDQLAATYEVVVSRVRYMAAQLERAIRIVGLSVPLSNARDVAAWIGAPQHAVYSFHPAVRPVPLEMRIQASTIAHFASRMDSWTAPVYRVLTESSTGPTLVFVPTRRLCSTVADDMLGLAAADELPSRFLKVDSVELELALQAVKDTVLRDLLPFGVGVFHEGLCTSDKRVVLSLYASGAIQVVVANRVSCWALDAVRAHTVVIMGAEKFSGREHRYLDYAVPEILQMMGRAGRPLVDEQAVCVLLCMSGKREFYKKFLYEPLPLESRLDGQLHDAMNSEVVAKTIESKQDAVDYLTWTLMYRRLVQNPNYYGLQGTSQQHLSEYLSELIESTLGDLAAAKCVAMDEEEMEVTATNLGMIAAYYQIRYVTVEMFALSLSAKTKLRGVLDILTAAEEFEALPIRHREAAVLERIANRLPVALPSSEAGEGEGRWGSPRVRAHLLLQAHFSRLTLPADLATDQAWVLARVLPLLQALVDVASSFGWLVPALAAMELSQMTVQAVWEGRDPLVKQVPHLGATEQRLALCKELGVNSVFDVMDMEDSERAKLLAGLLPAQVADVAAYVNRYPNMEVDVEVQDADEVTAGDAVSVRVTLDREWDEDDEADVGPVRAAFFPFARPEGWWVVVGDPRTQTLVAVKRVAVERHLETLVEFTAPESIGTVAYKLFLMCDGYLGCDQEFDLTLDVQAAMEEDDEEDDIE